MAGLLAMICLGSCYDDQGNYDYDWITTTSVEESGKSYTYEVGQAFVLRPEIRFMHKNGKLTESGVEDIFSDDAYDYYWIAKRYDKTVGVIVSDTIGRERNLNYIVDLAPELYLVEYQIYNKTNGVNWLSKFNLNVTLSAPEGWLFLEDKEGTAELSIYVYMADKEMRLVKNVLATSGIPASSLAGPRQVFATYQNQVGNGVWILTDHFTGYLNVKAGHQWTARQTVQNHMVEVVGDDFVLNSVQGVMFNTVFAFSNDGVRVSRYPGLFFTGDLLKPEPDRFEIAPYFGATGFETQTQQVLAFDKTNKKFRFLDISGNYNWLEADEKFPVGYDLKHMEIVGEAPSAQKIACLLTKDDKVYHMLASSPILVETGVKLLSSSEKFLNAEQCAFHKFLMLPYYLYDGKIYVNRTAGDDREVEYYRDLNEDDEVDPGVSEVRTELEGKIVLLTTVPFTDLVNWKYRRVFMNYVVVTTEMPDGSGRVYFLTPEDANAHKLKISDMVETDHKVISIDYQRPGI